MENVERDLATATASLLAAVLLPIWVTVLVFVGSSGVDDAPSEGTPLILAMVCFLAIPYGLSCRVVAFPILGRLLQVRSNPNSVFFISVLATVVVVSLIASSLLGIDYLGLTGAWQIIPYLAILVLVPPFATGFVAYSFLHRAESRIHNRG